MQTDSAHNFGHFFSLIEYGLTIQYEIEMRNMNALEQIVKMERIADRDAPQLQHHLANVYQFHWRITK